MCRRILRGFLYVGCSLLAVLQFQPLRAAVPDAAALQSIVDDAAAKFAESFAKQDATALAALFTPEAEYIDGAGTVFHGRDAIEAEYAATFAASPAGTLKIEVTSIRPIAETVIVEEGTSTFVANDAAAAGEAASQTRYAALHVQQADGSWLLAGVRELEEVPPTAAERLQSLAWLIGSWREERDGGVVETEWTWTPDRSALTAQYNIRDPDGEKRSGTHRVAWDPERKQFRSWVFESSGGFADGWWTAGDDGSWAVQLQGVAESGERMSAVVRYSGDGPDRLTISQEQRSLGGESLPSVTARVVRQPPRPAVAGSGGGS